MDNSANAELQTVNPPRKWSKRKWIWLVGPLVIPILAVFIFLLYLLLSALIPNGRLFEPSKNRLTCAQIADRSIQSFDRSLAIQKFVENNGKDVNKLIYYLSDSGFKIRNISNVIADKKMRFIFESVDVAANCLLREGVIIFSPIGDKILIKIEVDYNLQFIKVAE